MFPFQPYFTLNARRGLRGLVLEKGPEVIFKKLSADRALKLWRQGAYYLHITREGVKHFFGEATEPERIALLGACKTGGEVELILKGGHAHAALKNAARERLVELGLEPEPAADSTKPLEGTSSPRKRRS